MFESKIVAGDCLATLVNCGGYYNAALAGGNETARQLNYANPKGWQIQLSSVAGFF